jgi:hypothetical protein
VSILTTKASKKGAGRKGRVLQNMTVAYLRDEFNIPICFPAKGLHRGKKNLHGDSVIHQVDLIGFSHGGNVWLIESTTDDSMGRAKGYCAEVAKSFEKLKSDAKPKFVIVMWKNGREHPRLLTAYMPAPGEEIEWKNLQMR